MNAKWQSVIGLEIHVELSTNSKMFCRCSADYFGHRPNTHTCPVCLGLPGALPVPNDLAIEYTAKIGLALGSEIPKLSKFDRKNYFYPDLPKGYQISQYDLPIAVGGEVKIGDRSVRLNRVHLEEDTGKLIHAGGETLIDFNRSGVPLVEIVSEPDITSAEIAKAYAQKIQQIVRYLGVSDADMEKGSLRIDANISLRPEGSGQLGTKVEVKNLNSFRSLFKALEFEAGRQKEVLEKGDLLVQETRGWDEVSGKTVTQRSKEEAHDYRYFPEPDLLSITFEPADVAKLKKDLPELPDDKSARFREAYGLSGYDAEILTRSRDLADFFEEAASVGKKVKISIKTIANYIINKKPDISTVLPAHLVEAILKSARPVSISGGELANIVSEVLEENPKAASDYKKGKENALMFLTGQVSRQTQGKANPQEIIKMLKEAMNG